MNNITEDLLEKLSKDTESIEEVHTILERSFHTNVPPEACCALVSSLFVHAIENPTNQIQVYADILVGIHSYLSERAMMDDNDIFKNVAGILQESLYLYETEDDFTALFNQPLDEGQVMRVITLASAACLDVLRSFNGSESEPLCDVLWHLVPRSIDMLLAQVDEQNVIVITKLAAIAESLLSQNIILPSDDEVSWALHNMVAATLQCVPFTDQINIIASCVSAICTATQDLELLYTSDLVNSLADSLVNSNNHTLCKAMFNVSFLLARNNAATPWLSDFDTIQYDDSHFEKHILSICPPVFYKWFLKHFPEPIQWLASRTRYVKTLAVMSIVGYVVGHVDNTMFDVTSGDTVHVDLNLVFGKGEDLSVPERVPFRLTQNLTHAMGVLESAGLYTKTCEVAMTVLLRNKQSLLGVFQTLLNELDAADSASQKVTLRSIQKGITKIIGSIRKKMKVQDVNGDR